MKILILAQTTMQFEPPIFSLGTLLSEQGHEVCAVGFWESGLDHLENYKDNFEIIRVNRGKYNNFPRILRGGIRYFRYLLSLRSIGFSFQPNIIIPTNFDTLFGAAIIRKPNQRLVYYCTEYTPKPSRQSYKTGWGFIKALEFSNVKKADAIVSVEPERAQLQEKEWNRNVDFIILNTPLSDQKKNKNNTIDSIREYDLQLVYTGSIGERNLLVPLIKLLIPLGMISLNIYGRVQDQYKDVFFREIIFAEKKTNGRICYKNIIPYDQLTKTLRGYDIGVSLYDSNSINTKFASPAKFFEYMKAGLAIITTDQITPKKIIKEYKCGYIVSNIKGLETVLQQLLNDTETISKFKQNSKLAFENKLSYNIQSKPLIDWINYI